MQNDLTKFVNEELVPKVFESVPLLFPDMDFRPYPGGWQSGKKLDGTTPKEKRPDKTRITKKVPGRVFEQGGESLSLFDFESRRTGREFIEVVRDFSSRLGLEMPEGDPEAYKRHKEQQDGLSAAIEQMKRDLFSPVGKQTLDYLLGRGYSEEKVRKMGLGHVTKETLQKFQTVLSVPYGVGETHVLAVPYFSSGSIQGIKFRRLDNTKPKYLNDNKLDKKTNLFNLNGVRYAAEKAVLVEGELDALSLSADGVEGIVATAGAGLDESVLVALKKKSVRYVTILFDGDETGHKYTDQALAVLDKLDIAAFAAMLPEGEDPDSYIRKYGKDALESVLLAPMSSAQYRLNFAVCKEVGEGKEILHDSPQFEKVKQSVIRTANEYANPIDRNSVFRLFSEWSGDAIKEDDIRAVADNILEEKNLIKRNQETRKTVSELSELVEQGRVEEALETMREKSAILEKKRQETDLSKYLVVDTKEKYLARHQQAPEGLSLPYSFSKGADQTRLIIESAGLTFFCGGTSHGKSALIYNSVLHVADTTDGAILYFNLEESNEDVEDKLLNVSISRRHNGRPVSYNAIRTIQTFQRTGDSSFVRSDFPGNLEAERDLFLQTYISSGKIRLFTEKDADQICSIVRYISHRIKVSLVVLDYIQLVKRKGRKAKTEEIGEETEKLKNLATETRLPILCAVQLNRETPSPLEWRAENIADSADLERLAKTVVFLWKSSEKPSYKSAYKDKLDAIPGFSMGTEGQLFAELVKCRFGKRHSTAILSFDGNSGLISQQTLKLDDNDF